MPHYASRILEKQTATILIGWGMPAGAAERTAAIMVDADLRGVDSHGISMLPTYEARWTAGGLRLDTKPTVVHDDGRAGVVLDGRAGLGHVAGSQVSGGADGDQLTVEHADARLQNGASFIPCSESRGGVREDGALAPPAARGPAPLAPKARLSQ